MSVSGIVVVEVCDVSGIVVVEVCDASGIAVVEVGDVCLRNSCCRSLQCQQVAASCGRVAPLPAVGWGDRWAPAGGVSGIVVVEVCDVSR